MTEQFFSILRERMSALVQDLRYQHPPTGTMIAPQIIDIMLPRPTEAVEEGEEYPFVRWLVYKGQFERSRPASFSLLIDGGIYEEGTVVEGSAAISKLCVALGKIVQVPRFALYRISGPVRFTLGAMEADTQNPGLQAHPYHHCRLLVDFDISPAQP